MLPEEKLEQLSHEVFHELVTRDPKWNEYLRLGERRRDLIEAILKVVIKELDARKV